MDTVSQEPLGIADTHSLALEQADSRESRLGEDEAHETRVVGVDRSRPAAARIPGCHER